MNAGLIFYCDDDPDDLFIFQETVFSINPELGCAVASEGDEALQLLTSGNVMPDMIFLDINMPKMSGVELLSWLAKYNALGHVPVIMYSTTKNEHEQKQCLELGAKAVLKKGYTIDTIKEQLSSTIHTFCPTLMPAAK